MFYLGAFFLNKKTVEFNRRWLKVQDVIAVAGSFVKTTGAGCFLVVIWKATETRDRRIIEKLLNMESSVAERTAVQDIKVDSITSTTYFPKRELEEKPGLRARWFNWCRKSKANKYSDEFFEKARGYIKEKIDVIALVRLFDSFEKLKEITLTVEQLQEFSDLRNVAFN